MSSKVNQKGNKATNIAGQDIHNHYGSELRTSISHLLDKLENEEDEKASQNESIIEELAFFKKRAINEIRGLDKKLQVSKLSKTSILQAKRAKERYVKNLESHIHSETAQRIHSHFLDDAYTRFNIFIKPNLKEYSESEILETVHKKITNHIMDLLERNYLDFNDLVASGTVYFLTGNCHLSWDEE